MMYWKSCKHYFIFREYKIHQKIKFEVQIYIYLRTDEQVQEELVNGLKCFIKILILDTTESGGVLRFESYMNHSRD